jgi:hypothetical protein
MPILVQSLKLRLKQLCTEYKDDAELLALVPYPDGDYEPQSDNGVFGKAWQEWDEIGGCSELVDRWLDFEAGAGVFDHFCEIKGTYVLLPKVAEVEKKPPKKPSKKAPKPVEVKMRNGYAPLRVSKDLELKNFPKSIKDWVEKIFEAIQKVVAARALKKTNDDKALALKKKMEELVASQKQAVAFAAAAVPVFNAAAAAYANPAQDEVGGEGDEGDDDAKAEGDEEAEANEGELAQQLLLMEEQTFDAKEDDQQLAMRHGQLINYRAEEASAVLEKTKIKPKRDAASAGDDIPTLLIKVPKGMYFLETGWRDGETLKVLAERVTFHKLDVVRFFTDEAILKKYAGVCDALCVCV